jgi:hypothetical protein
MHRSTRAFHEDYEVGIKNLNVMMIIELVLLLLPFPSCAC